MKVSKEVLLNLLWLFVCFSYLFFSRLPGMERLGTVVVPCAIMIIVFVEKRIYLRNELMILFGVFVLWACATVFWSLAPSRTLAAIQTLLGILGLWYLIYRLVESQRDVGAILTGFWAVALSHGVATLALAEQGEIFARTSGLFGDGKTNSLASFMLFGVVAATATLMLRRFGAFRIALLLGSIALFVFVATLSGSRKGALAILVFGAVVMLFLASSKYKKWVAAFLVVCILGFFALDDSVLSQTPLAERSQADYVEQSLGARQNIISSGLFLFVEHPIVGIGVKASEDPSVMGRNFHNDIIDVLGSTGLIGLMIYVLFYVRAFRLGAFCIRHTKSYSQGVILIAFLVAFVLVGFGGNNYMSPFAMFAFCLFSSVAYVGLKRARYDELERGRGRP